MDENHYPGVRVSLPLPRLKPSPKMAPCLPSLIKPQQTQPPLRFIGEKTIARVQANTLQARLPAALRQRSVCAPEGPPEP